MDNIKYILFKSWAKVLLDRNVITLDQFNALCSEIDSVQRVNRG